MSKVTFTKERMDAIKRIRDGYKAREQIVLAWHGYAEVEKEYIDFEEAMKALSKGETIYYHYTATTIFGEASEKTLKINFGMKPTYFCNTILWEDLVKGKFTIKKGELNDEPSETL